ncbi:TetR/AcrR family transcriptional regulator [Mycolicibacterium peregrinum]|uniref:TetR/AcrR family transcriptional regulator n=1 Tax=Mycolicibacterium TaxID=1866885 RepID=UPI003AAF2AAD
MSTSNARSADARPSVRHEQRLLTRQRILQAARDTFVVNGYTSTTIGEIVKRAGIYRATFYQHFDSKLDVFVVLLDEVASDSVPRWRELDSVLCSNSKSALRKFIAQSVALWQSHATLLPAIKQAYVTEQVLVGKVDAAMAVMSGELVNYFGKFSKPERRKAELRVRLMVLQLDELYYRQVAQQQPIASEGLLLDVVVDLWWNALKLP